MSRTRKLGERLASIKAGKFRCEWQASLARMHTTISDDMLGHVQLSYTEYIH